MLIFYDFTSFESSFLGNFGKGNSQPSKDYFSVLGALSIMCKLTRFVVVLRETLLSAYSCNNNKINALIVLGTYFGAYKLVRKWYLCREKSNSRLPMFYAVVF